jgi:ABC-type transport system involved in cytochrome bd biosynthesis fused ATPase/permease subunit
MSENNYRSGVLGAVLIGIGCGLTAAGLALVIPAVASWSLKRAEDAIQKGREQVESAAAMFGEVAGRAQQRFGEAAKTAREKTSKAAGAVETAARKVREFTAEGD